MHGSEETRLVAEELRTDDNGFQVGRGCGREREALQLGVALDAAIDVERPGMRPKSQLSRPRLNMSSRQQLGEPSLT